MSIPRPGFVVLVGTQRTIDRNIVVPQVSSPSPVLGRCAREAGSSRGLGRPTYRRGEDFHTSGDDTPLLRRKASVSCDLDGVSGACHC